jgi:tetratricopeptide (TPR) repeat protein
MTVAGEAPRCPPPEVLAAFVDARLAKNQVVSLSEHLSSCAECRFVIESAAEALAEEQAETIEPQGRRSWRWLSIAAVIGAVTFSSPFAWTAWQANQVEIRALIAAIPSEIRAGVEWLLMPPRRRSREAAVHELVAVVDSSKVRILEPRVTDFGYGSVPPTYRGGETEESAEQLIIEGKAGQVLSNTEGDQSAAAAHARGIAQLVMRKPTAAIEELTAATKAGPNDAKVWSDLAAARYIANDYAGARDAANRALSIDPNLNEARFNRALAMSRLQPAESIKEWTEYLKHDSTSPWATEARQRIEMAREFQ